MKGGFLIILFFYVLLLENGTELIPVLYDLGNGMEIRVTLILKVLFLLSTLTFWILNKSKFGIPKPIIIFSGFLLLSTAYVYFTKPSFFMSALSVNFHIQLMLNMAIYLYFNLKSEKEVYRFSNMLSTFGMLNAFLVIFSFFFYETFDFFEAGVKNSETVRAFGLMGDEVSIFLTFFLYEALVAKKYKHFLVFFMAILMTGGVGAFLTTIALITYYGTFVIKKSFYVYYFLITLFLFLGLGSFLFKDQLKEFGVIKRIVNNIKNPEKETGNLRIISMTAAIDMINTRPILGSGYGAYASHIKEKYAPIFKNAGYDWKIPSAMVIIGSTFNPYLQILCEAGIIGLIFYIFFLIWVSFSIKGRSIEYFNEKTKNLKEAHFGWVLVFVITAISANWFLPASFLLLLVVSILGMHLKINRITIEGANL